MRTLLDRFRHWLFWLALSDIHPNRDHRRHGWGPTHITRKDYR